MRVFAAELKKLLILFKADPKSLVAGIIAPTIILIVFAWLPTLILTTFCSPLSLFLPKLLGYV